jgi:hypothetical protein
LWYFSLENTSYCGLNVLERSSWARKAKRAKAGTYRAWPAQGRRWQPPGGNHREILSQLIFKYASLLLRVRQQLKPMKVGDPVYLITDQLQTGAGIPAIICALRDSTIEVAVETAHGTKIMKVRNREDILPSNLYTHSILNVVYHTYHEIELKYGSILNLSAEEIGAQLIQHGLAPQTARRCADLFDDVEWLKAPLPLRQWLRRIRDFYHKRPSPAFPNSTAGSR